MKDEHDKVTLDLVPDAPAVASASPVSRGAAPPLARKRARVFQIYRSRQDEQSASEPRPNCAKTVLASGMFGGNFVPVLFAAKDWKVSPRRIRALLSEGRLLGRLLENGYWEVRFPYQFTMGTRGPGLKRHQRPPDKPKNPEAIQERQP